MFSFITSRRNLPIARVASASVAPGFFTSTAYLRKSGILRVAQQQAAVAMRIGAHAALALGRELGKLGFEAAIRVEEFLRPVALHPLFEDLDVPGLLVHLAHRHLVRTPRILGALAVNFLRDRSSPWASAG